VAKNTVRLKLDEFLLVSKRINQEQLQEARERQQGSKRALQDLLIEMNFVSDEDVFNWLTTFTNVPVESLLATKVDSKAAKLLPYKYTVEKAVIPYRIAGNDLFVAMSNPLDVLTVDEMRRMTGMNIRPSLVRHSEVMKAIEKVNEVDDTIYDVLKNVMVEEDDVTFLGNSDSEKDEEQIMVEEEEAVSGNPIVRLVNLILTDAIRARASDIHIEPTEKILFVKYRIDGMLKTIMKLPMAVAPRVAARIKIMSKLDIAEKRVPQDGRAFIATRDKKLDLRVSVLPLVYGEKIVIRLLDKSSGVIGLEKLNMSEKERDRVDVIITKPYGMFLVVGPTGSGKSTTLYSILTKIKTDDNNVITVEDPVEYELRGVNQVQVNVKAGLTFPAALRSMLRQDPDIIMVGEIRDAETGEIAVRASMTGHLVMSTAHTNDSSSAITRLTDIGIDRFLIASSLLGVIAQRLVRKLCPHCKKNYKPDERLLALISGQMPFLKDQVFYEPVGCERCHFTGYSGRMALFEILVVSEKVRAMIISGENDRAIMHAALKEGMETLFMSGLRKVYEGVTSLAELFRVVEFQEIDIQLCPECRNLVEIDWHNCVNCGRKLDFHCPACQANVRKGWKFCQSCGRDLSATSAEVPEAKASAGRPRIESLLQPEKATYRRPTLLIVEDDPAVRKIVKLTLKDMFSDILETENGEEGLRLAQQLVPDLMVLDIMLPGLNGFDVCRSMRRSLVTTQVPVVLLTALSEEEGQKEGIDVGADDYITKPFSPAKLRQRIELLLKRHTRLTAN
jgi:type IV pilus assembly protein PilB